METRVDSYLLLGHSSHSPSAGSELGPEKVNLEESACGEKEGRELKYLDLKKTIPKNGSNPLSPFNRKFFFYGYSPVTLVD